MADARFNQWRQLPTKWIHDQELKQLQWGLHGADAIAALMVLLVMAHKRKLLTDGTNSGHFYVTYDDLESALNISRSKISKGISLLVQQGWIVRGEGRSLYSFTSSDIPWGKVAVRALYDRSGAITAFDAFRLRNSLELDALKLYLLLVAFRDTQKNYVTMSYHRMNEYTGVQVGKIKGAMNYLVVSHLIYVEREAKDPFDHTNPANLYRLRGVDSYRHAGTGALSETSWRDEDVPM
jgi:biotin operon repressor